MPPWTRHTPGVPLMASVQISRSVAATASTNAARVASPGKQEHVNLGGLQHSQFARSLQNRCITADCDPLPTTDISQPQHRQCPGPPRVNRTTLVECGLCTQTPRWSGAGSYRRDSRRGKTQAARPRRTRAAVRTSSREIANSSATTSPGSPALSIAATSATRGPAVPKRGWPNP